MEVNDLVNSFSSSPEWEVPVDAALPGPAGPGVWTPVTGWAEEGGGSALAGASAQLGSRG